jgi:hypothetical protein
MPTVTLIASAIELYERPTSLRLPFRFGRATLREAPQAFVRARVRLDNGAEACGMAAELMVPKWFDKNPQQSNESNINQLRRSLQLARQLYLADKRVATPFGLFARHYLPQLNAAAVAGLNPLEACFGSALLDRAVLDGACRALGLSFYDAARQNLIGLMPTELTPDLQDFDFAAFLSSLRPSSHLHVRHTVGMLDAVTAVTVRERIDDGLPESLEEVIHAYGNRYFKIKVSANLQQDIERLSEIAALLDARLERYFVTLDGNEQFTEIAAVAAFWQRIGELPALSRLARSVICFEQPLPRSVSLQRPLGDIADAVPLLIDESDDTLDAFPCAKALGYCGISSKSCKGIYKSLLNAARCVRWNRSEGAERYFLSAEDLTTQAGLAVQQDLALANLLGLHHVERNGHHYVNGMAAAPAHEQRAFPGAHPDLYEFSHGVTRLRIADGKVSVQSLGGSGFASAAEPDWSALLPMPVVDSPMVR